MLKLVIPFVCALVVMTACGGDSHPQLHEEEMKKGGDSAPVFFLEERYFNETEVVNGQMTIMNPDNIVVNVNKDYRLPEDYRPGDLTIPNVPFPFDEEDDRRYLRAEAAKALEALFAAAAEEGYELFAISGFRSYERQELLYEEALENQGEDQDLVAMPGHSEHQTGLAMDISSASVDYGLIEAFGLTAEGQWVAEHAHQFGFIIRYPAEKEGITGYGYEPWHLRYVGDVANDIYNHFITLEEYLENVKKL